ncbi:MULTISPECIES: hypothetical protein [Altibacter]|uniref:hypothetical protein n=1 Tax=Altibacter TaxID=1535231 RepID=UPI00054D98B7|nr:MULTISPECIES: hypothetical protein [Altibacter]MCW9036797.1 hypothetical protein [Altibacter sp.]
MKGLKRVFSFYIQSSIHVALAVLALFLVTQVELELELQFSLLGYVFFGTITGYNFVKYAAIAGLHHRRLTDSLKSIQIFSLGCFVLLLYFALQQSFQVLAVSTIFGILTLLYAIPLIRKKNLRNFSGIKIFIVAIVWAGVTVILPVIASEETIDLGVWISTLQRIMIVIALTIPFEIRDLPFDKKTLGTLPQRIGVFATKTLGSVLLGVCFLIEYFKEDVFLPYAVSLLIVCVLTAVLILFSEKKQPAYYASFWVEGIPIVWYLLLLLAIQILA